MTDQSIDVTKSFRETTDDQLLDLYDTIRDQVSDVMNPPWFYTKEQRAGRSEGFERLKEVKGELEVRRIKPRNGKYLV